MGLFALFLNSKGKAFSICPLSLRFAEGFALKVLFFFRLRKYPLVLKQLHFDVDRLSPKVMLIAELMTVVLWYDQRKVCYPGEVPCQGAGKNDWRKPLRDREKQVLRRIF